LTSCLKWKLLKEKPSSRHASLALKERLSNGSWKSFLLGSRARSLPTSITQLSEPGRIPEENSPKNHNKKLRALESLPMTFVPSESDNKEGASVEEMLHWPGIRGS